MFRLISENIFWAFPWAHKILRILGEFLGRNWERAFLANFGGMPKGVLEKIFEKTS